MTKGVSVRPFSHLLAEGVSEKKAFSSESSIVSPAGSQSSGHPHHFYICPIAYCLTSFLQGRFVPREIHKRTGSTKSRGEGEEAVYVGECSCVCEFFMQPSKRAHIKLCLSGSAPEKMHGLSGLVSTLCLEDRVLGGLCLQDFVTRAPPGPRLPVCRRRDGAQPRQLILPT